MPLRKRRIDRAAIDLLAAAVPPREGLTTRAWFRRNLPFLEDQLRGTGGQAPTHRDDLALAVSRAWGTPLTGRTLSNKMSDARRGGPLRHPGTHPQPFVLVVQVPVAAHPAAPASSAAPADRAAQPCWPATPSLPRAPTSCPPAPADDSRPAADGAAAAAALLDGAAALPDAPVLVRTRQPPRIEARRLNQPPTSRPALDGDPM